MKCDHCQDQNACRVCEVCDGGMCELCGMAHDDAEGEGALDTFCNGVSDQRISTTGGHDSEATE